MQLEHIALRAAFVWFFLFALLRLSGHATIAHLTGRSLVLTLVLSDLIDDVLFSQVSVAVGLVAMSSTTLIALLVAIGVQHSERFERLVEGRPFHLLRNGVVDQRERRGALVGMGEISEQMRHHGLEADEWHEVRELILEGDDASMSVLPEEWAEPVKKKDRQLARDARK